MNDANTIVDGRIAEVFVAACTGSARLAGEVGMPLVHIDVACDAGDAIRRLNAVGYGLGVRNPHSSQPAISRQTGWRDWALFDYAPSAWNKAMGVRPQGVRVARGRITVALPAGVAISEFREELHAALKHLRLTEVTSETAYLLALRDPCLGTCVVQPRYTPDKRHSFRGARRVDDIYAFDPALVPWRLFWIVVAVRSALIEGASP